MGIRGNENITFANFHPEPANKPNYTIGRKSGIEEKWPTMDICISNLTPSRFFKEFHWFWVYWLSRCLWKTATGAMRWDWQRKGNNRWHWEGNWNKTWLSLAAGMRMGMTHWERERLGLKKTFRSSLVSLVPCRVDICNGWCTVDICSCIFVVLYDPCCLK